MNYQTLFDAVEAYKQPILDAERCIWNNPEPGYREWKTHAYLKKQYEALGYTLVEAGNIPGFYTDVDTGRPGPKLVIFGEMDSLIVPSHPECDKETGAVHACGHNCQSAALLGVAAALKAPGALDGLSGSIRLAAVPAEELIELEYRKSLRDQGVIKYFGGKVEFLYRGYLDGCDLAMMVHTGASHGNTHVFTTAGSNGCVVKQYRFTGKASHAAAPGRGINALYAAEAALGAANALRETFSDSKHIRFHPIITNGGASVNAIPDLVEIEAYVRGSEMKAIAEVNEKINRAFACSAAAMGCGLRINDMPGYAPRINDQNMAKAYKEIGTLLFGEEGVKVTDDWVTGCSDMGDISTVMPAIHPSIGGAVGHSHGDDYYVTDPYLACVQSAKLQAGVAALLLKDSAKAAKKVIAEAKVTYPDHKSYFEAIDALNFEKDAVVYKDGEILISYKK